MSKQPPSPPSRLSEADPEFLRLSLCYLEGELSAEGLEKLQAQLRADPAKRAAFVRLCLTGSALIEAVSEGAASGTGPGEDKTKLDAGAAWPQSNDLNDAMVLPAVVPDADPPEPEALTIPLPAAARTSSQPRRRWLLAAAILLPLMLACGLWAWMGSRRIVVATLEKAVDAQWDGSALAAGSSLAQGQHLRLQSGFAQVAFMNGAEVVVEGPADFEIVAADQGALHTGKLVAHVIERAHGFSVRSQNVIVTDLGTEFGMSADRDGTGRVEVFQGSVRAESPGTEAGGVQQQILTAGQAAQIAQSGITVDSAGASPQHFVRSLAQSPAPLDVVDLISGGDGTTRRRGTDIDSMGRVGVFKQVADVVGDYVYHRITGTSVLDGCFVPDGGRGPVQVDSASHTFAFRATSNHSLRNICTGGPIPPLTGQGAPLLTQYAGPEHSVLYMVANRGLTLDLAAIRRLHPGTAIKSFHCLVSSIFPWARTHARASLDVIVDGESRFQKTFANEDGAFPIEAALRPDDRFLTIAITEAGNSPPVAGTMFADASLETSNGATPSPTTP